MNSKKFLLSTAAVFLLAQTQLLAAGGRSGVSTKTEKPAGVTGKSGGDSAADSQRDFEAGRARAGSGTGAATGTAAGATTAPTARTMPPTGGHATTPKINLNAPKTGTKGARSQAPLSAEQVAKLFVDNELGAAKKGDGKDPLSAHPDIIKVGERLAKAEVLSAKVLERYNPTTMKAEWKTAEPVIAKLSFVKDKAARATIEANVLQRIEQINKSNMSAAQKAEAIKELTQFVEGLAPLFKSGKPEEAEVALAALNAAAWYAQDGKLSEITSRIEGLKNAKGEDGKPLSADEIARSLGGYAEFLNIVGKLKNESIETQLAAGGNVDWSKVNEHVNKDLTEAVIFQLVRNGRTLDEAKADAGGIICGCSGKEMICPRH